MRGVPMSITAIQIIAPTTAGATSDAVECSRDANTTFRLSGAAAVLAGAETATVQYQDASGTWRNLVDAIAGAAQITAGESAVTIACRGAHRIVLTATGALTGIEVITNNAS